MARGNMSVRKEVSKYWVNDYKICLSVLPRNDTGQFEQDCVYCRVYACSLYERDGWGRLD